MVRQWLMRTGGGVDMDQAEVSSETHTEAEQEFRAERVVLVMLY
jgi:hypothetical protein